MTDQKTGQETTETLDIWVAGTEEAQFQPTDEGAQEFAPDESEYRLADQFGRVITDDYVFDDEVGEDERGRESIAFADERGTERRLQSPGRRSNVRYAAMGLPFRKVISR